MPSPFAWLLLSVAAGGMIVGWRQAVRWRRTALTALCEAKRWEGIAASREHALGVWIHRACSRGYIADPRQVLRDIFAPSTEHDVEAARAWRERRAICGPDHTRRFTVEATNDSEAAREILTGIVGGLEVDE